MRAPRKMNRNAPQILSILLAATLAAALPAIAAAQSVENVYRGKLVRVVVGSAAGGAYDLFARAIFRHMGQHLPGNPTFIVENMPGGGGLLSANYDRVEGRAALDHADDEAVARRDVVEM